MESRFSCLALRTIQSPPRRAPVFLFPMAVGVEVFANTLCSGALDAIIVEACLIGLLEVLARDAGFVGRLQFRHSPPPPPPMRYFLGVRGGGGGGEGVLPRS